MEQPDSIELDFMVDPVKLSELLAAGAIRDPVRCKVVDPGAIFLTGILGESGRKLVIGGIEFYFTNRPKPGEALSLAQKLIAAGIAVKTDIWISSDGCSAELSLRAELDELKVKAARLFDALVTQRAEWVQICNERDAFAAQVAAMREEIAKITQLRWGYDGDGGAVTIAQRALDITPADALSFYAHKAEDDLRNRSQPSSEGSSYD